MLIVYWTLSEFNREFVFVLLSSRSSFLSLSPFSVLSSLSLSSVNSAHSGCAALWRAQLQRCCRCHFIELRLRVVAVLRCGVASCNAAAGVTSLSCGCQLWLCCAAAWPAATVLQVSLHNCAAGVKLWLCCAAAWPAATRLHRCDFAELRLPVVAVLCCSMASCNCAAGVTSQLCCRCQVVAVLRCGVASCNAAAQV